MDWVFDVATSSTFDHLTLPREENYITFLNLAKAEIASFEPQSAALLISN